MARTGEVVTNDTVKSLRQPAKKNYTFIFIFWGGALLLFLFVCLFLSRFRQLILLHGKKQSLIPFQSDCLRFFQFSGRN